MLRFIKTALQPIIIFLIFSSFCPKNIFELDDVCQSGLKLLNGINKQEVVVVPKKQIKMGFFEKLFHFFR